MPADGSSAGPDRSRKSGRGPLRRSRPSTAWKGSAGRQSTTFPCQQDDFILQMFSIHSSGECRVSDRLEAASSAAPGDPSESCAARLNKFQREKGHRRLSQPPRFGSPRSRSLSGWARSAYAPSGRFSRPENPSQEPENIECAAGSDALWPASLRKAKGVNLPEETKSKDAGLRRAHPSYVARKI